MIVCSPASLVFGIETKRRRMPARPPHGRLI
jgi:hypothetical protein